MSLDVRTFHGLGHHGGHVGGSSHGHGGGHGGDGGRYVVRCKDCNVNIYMAQDLKTGNWRPVDIAGAIDGPGNIVFRGHPVIKCEALTKEDLASGLRWIRHMPHQATCAALMARRSAERASSTAAEPAEPREYPDNVIIFPSRSIH